jgi:aryl-alcohol dehydrogenase-like predicted oxidoreductase
MTLTRRAFNKAGLGLATTLALGGGEVVAGPGGMLKRAIPSSGEMIPVVGLGTNRYGVDTSEAARAPLRAALGRFAELGGTVIDTAPMYRTSESVLGDLIAELGIRDELFVATKTDQDAGGEATDAQMRDSQRKLRTETFDLMQVHNLRGWREALPAMRDWKAEGRIRYIGITTSRENQYEEFEQVMRQEDLDFVQLNYSVEQRASAERLMPLAQDRGMAVMINRGFGGGRIFEAVGDQPVPDWAREFDCTSWAQVLLKYALSHPAATVAIPGMTKVRHVDDNVMAGHGRMPDAAERKRIEAFYDSL